MRLRNLSVFFFLFLAVLVLPGKTYSQDKFEGKVTFNVFNDGESHTMQYYVKGSKLRFDANENGQSGQIVMDPSTKQLMIIMPERKMYMVMPFPEVKDNNTDSDSKDKKADFVKTGETKDILGYTAEKWTYKDGENQGEAWMTKDIGGFQLFDNPMQQNQPQWQKDLQAEGYFPLLVYENGDKVFEVTNIDKQPVDASMFEPPAGFQKMDMPTMPQK